MFLVEERSEVAHAIWIGTQNKICVSNIDGEPAAIDKFNPTTQTPLVRLQREGAKHGRAPYNPLSSLIRLSDASRETNATAGLRKFLAVIIPSAVNLFAGPSNCICR